MLHSQRDEDEERAEKERAKERQREKWREDPSLSKCVLIICNATKRYLCTRL
jgi:hypothetical protein